MAVAKLKSSEWALVAVMARPDERSAVPEAHNLHPSPEALSQAKAHNWAIHTHASVAQNVDKGFHHFITHFKPQQDVEASICVEKGLQNEYWQSVFFQQGRHWCVLAGVLGGRPEEEWLEDAMWTACSAWENFDPVHGKLKERPEALFVPESCTHFFEGNEDTLFDLSHTQLYREASPFRKQLIEDFCLGFRKFESPPFLGPLMDAPLRYQGYAKFRASSRRYQVYDSEDCWTQASSFEVGPDSEKGRSIPDTGSSGPALG
jgi:hypothetical protein